MGDNESEIRNLVKRSIEKVGVNGTAKILGLSAEATCRLGGGINVQAGTVAQARERAPKLEAAIAGDIARAS